MIPILDWRDFARDKAGFVEALGAAARGPGFFVLTYHEIAAELVADTFAAADRLFALPHEAKAAVAISKANRGYVGRGTEALDEASGVRDRKEAFNIGLELSANDPRMDQPFRGANLWPDLPGFRETVLAYFDAAWRQGVALHRAVALDLGLAEDHFDAAFDAPMATLRLLNYPAGDASASIGAGAHTDYGSLTLLMTDGVGGLQVRLRGGDWIDAPKVAPVDGQRALIVNIGDCLMRWTNDIYVSTPHRVVAPPEPRRSIAFFLDPNPDARIAALPGTVEEGGRPRYEETTGADYLASRLAATYA